MRVFIIYTHDNSNHKNWVKKLAQDLIKSNIDVLLDEFDVELGGSLPYYMEQSVINSDRVLVICTDEYVKKSDERLGGAGYEISIIASQLVENYNQNKFIPLVRGATTKKVPTCLAGRRYIDFSNDIEYEINLKELINNLKETSEKLKPTIEIKTEITLPDISIDDNKITPFKSDDNLSMSATAFFSTRFANTFPGLRSIKSFTGKDAIDRLERLLAAPLVFHNINPIWWFRDGDMHISSFNKLDDETIIIDETEYKIDSITAVYNSSYFRQFVYIETKPMQPTGLYNIDISDMVEKRGYAYEEFGIYKNMYIPRSHVDDGATEIDNKLITLGKDAIVRIRYLSPYNFIICAQNNPINHPGSWYLIKKYMNGILKKENTLSDFIEWLNTLPNIREY